MAKSREQPPQPLAVRRYSGQFKVRIPPRVHRQLALEAAEERVSLNRLVAAKLTHGLAPAYPADPLPPPSAPPARCSRRASSRSLSIMRRTSSANDVLGFHPSTFVAFDGSPSR